jgi:hypothetical protein
VEYLLISRHVLALALGHLQVPICVSEETNTRTNTTPRVHHSFHPRVVNNTDITFSNKEIELLEKGPKYNIHHKKKHWLTNLALKAETAISLLHMND